MSDAARLPLRIPYVAAAASPHPSPRTSRRTRRGTWRAVLARLAGSGVALLAVFAPHAHAHGGTYRGPGSGIGPAGPSGIPGATGGPSGGGPSTGGSADSAGDLTAWQTWWALNRDPFLALRDALADEGANSASDVFFQSGLRSPANRPTDDVVRGKVAPTLRALLEQARGPDVVTAALLALAKLGPAGGDGLAAAIVPHLASSNQEIAETAALALGVLGEASSASTLVDLLEDGEKGRKACARDSVPVRTRAFAAYALGLLGREARNPDVRRYVVHHLVAAARADTTSSTDLGVACTMAIGIVPLDPLVPSRADAPASASRRGQIAYLLELWRDAHRPDVVRAYAPVAIARLARAPAAARDVTADRTDFVVAPRPDPDLAALALPALLEVLAPASSASAVLRQSAVAAVGLLADADPDPLDAEARAALVRQISGGDRLSRRLAQIALARVASRVGHADPADARQAVRGALLGELQRGSTSERPWTGLALGLLERGVAESGGAPSDAVRDALVNALVEHGGPTEAGAYATALALLGRDAEAPLRKALGDARDDSVRAYAAVALGIARAMSATEPLRALIPVSRYRPHLLREVAIGLALLGDKSVTAALIPVLRESVGMSAQAALATALGFVGDAAALGPLLGLAADATVPNGTRAFAVVAAGLVCDRRALPWNTVYALDANYWLPPSTLFDPIGATGVLDLL